jgi:uncharacterized damage-inducible protein DinB
MRQVALEAEEFMKSKFRYKAWANAEILASIAKIDSVRHPDPWRLAIRLMNHTYVVDRIFAAHLSGAAHEFQDTNTHETPSLDQLRDRIAASDDWYQHYVSRLPQADLCKPVSFVFTDGDRGSMTREEMLSHILLHGAYHRGNVGMILTSCGIDRPKDTFTRFLHLSEPNRRDAT